MRRGDFAAAWRISDAVLRARAARCEAHKPRHLQQIWDGRTLAGRRVLVRCYHGLGDTVQFVRFMPGLRRIASATTLWAQPALLPLLRLTPALGPLAPLHDGAPDVAFDVDVEIMELAHVLRIGVADLPGPMPYLSAPAPSVERRRGACLQVGLVWEAGDWDARRAVPSELLAGLGDVPGVTFHVIQRGPAAARCPLRDAVVSGSDDVRNTAAMLRALDLLISVDSFPAHLAGALGVDVWTLLHAEADWRWMSGRADSPWYPRMRLFRQPRPGDWPSVIAAVAHALRLKQR